MSKSTKLSFIGVTIRSAPRWARARGSVSAPGVSMTRKSACRLSAASRCVHSLRGEIANDRCGRARRLGLGPGVAIGEEMRWTAGARRDRPRRRARLRASRRRPVDGDGGLSSPALLVADDDDARFGHRRSPWPNRRVRDPRIALTVDCGMPRTFARASGRGSTAPS